MEPDHDWLIAPPSFAVLLVTDTRWTCLDLPYLPWLRSEGEQSSDKLYNETVAKSFLQLYEHITKTVWNQFMEATCNYVTSITKKNQEEMG
uniref:Uncharacterized protein n=1 Tax=Pipistrellus kuhlii TaxID=59472 RepID=A0A7J7U744_PIPKU|nr:hypothetical protein mPipKuh1_000149 [Pipistrellus kuhlii]